MPLKYLWERNEDARRALLSECMDVVDGGGPDPVRKQHLACVVDWALRERTRGDELERVLHRLVAEARIAIETGDALSDGVDVAVRRSVPTSQREH